jgi:hypothetical protein
MPREDLKAEQNALGARMHRPGFITGAGTVARYFLTTPSKGKMHGGALFVDYRRPVHICPAAH